MSDLSYPVLGSMIPFQLMKEKAYATFTQCWYGVEPIPVQLTANTRHSPKVGSMLAQRLRRWSTIEPTLVNVSHFLGGQLPVLVGFLRLHHEVVLLHVTWFFTSTKVVTFYPPTPCSSYYCFLLFGADANDWAHCFFSLKRAFKVNTHVWNY